MKYSKLITYLIIALLLVIVCPIFTVCSQATTIVLVTPSTISPALGETFYVTVSLSNVQNLYGLEVILKWNASVLRALSADVRLGVETFPDGVLHVSPSFEPVFVAENNLTQTEGEYRLVATSVSSASSFNGSGNVVKLTFEADGVGGSVLDLESQLLDYPPNDRDPRISLPISHLSQDSSLIVNKSTSTEPSQTDRIPPEICVVSPLNQTYDESDVSLVFNLNEPVNWTGYSLDGKDNSTIIGNFTLRELSNGMHTVTVYANDTAGNMGVSETSSFNIYAPKIEAGSFSIVPIAVIVAIIVLGVSLLVYFKKRKH